MQSCDVTSRPVAIFSGKAVTALEQSQVYLKLRPRRHVSLGKRVTKSVPTHSVTGQQRDSEKLRQAMDERRRIVCERTIRHRIPGRKESRSFASCHETTLNIIEAYKTLSSCLPILPRCVPFHTMSLQIY